MQVLTTADFENIVGAYRHGLGFISLRVRQDVLRITEQKHTKYILQNVLLLRDTLYSFQ